MSLNIVDTNVILVANNSHEDISPECVLKCVQSLNELMKSGTLVLDDRYLILREYQNKTAPQRGKGVGDLFVKWALTMLGSPTRVHQVSLTTIGPDQYAEFPDIDLQETFDAPDRIFPAVSNAHLNRPPILQAADCKWLDWWPKLHAKGIEVQFLCGSDVCRFYEKKFPNSPKPQLP